MISNSEKPSGRKRHALAQEVVRIGPLMNLPALVRDLGYDPGPIFSSLGFDPEQFTNPDTEVSFVRESQLLARCVAETGCDHLGFLLGERTTPSSLGIVGFMLPTAPNVGSALSDLVRHLDLHDEGGTVALDIEDRYTFLRYTVHVSWAEAIDQIGDLSMVLACKIMRALCGESWDPRNVYLPRRKPKEPATYRHFFNAPLHFGADHCSLAFPTSWLNHRVASSDPLLHSYLEKEARELRALQKTDFVTHFRHLLRKSLSTQQTSAGDMARQIGIHERTLNRRLREAGTTFRREFEDIRYEIARQLLTDTDMPLSQIASSLNYADGTVFSRAFKRWSGETPKDWRRLHRC